MIHPCPLINLINNKDMVKFVKVEIDSNDIICLNEEQKIKAKKDSLFNNRFVAEAQIKILSNNQEYIAKPIYIIEDNKVGLVPDIVDDLGIKVYLSEIKPNDDDWRAPV